MAMNNRRMTPTQEPGVLDFAPGAAAAYSLRNLSLSYAGPVVTVRRSADNAEADFTASEVSDGTLAAWCGGGDGFVKQWWSQTGSNHASNSTAAQQPKLVSAGVLVFEGGKPALQFDGSDDVLEVAGQTFTRLGSVYCIGRSTKNLGVQAVIRLGEATAATFRFDNTNLRYYAPGSPAIDIQKVVDPTVLWHISAISDGSAVDIFYNAVSLGSASGSASYAPTKLFIGNYGTSEDYSGVLHEILIYQDAAPALRDRITADQMWYY